MAVSLPLVIAGIAATGFLIAAISNLIGTTTGQNPMAQVGSVMMQTMMPMIITLMPMAVMINLLMSMINTMMQPIERIGRIIQPPAPSLPVIY